MTGTVAVFHHPFSLRVPALLEQAVVAAGAEVRTVDVPSIGISFDATPSVWDRQGRIEVSHAGPLLSYWHPTALLGIDALHQQGVRPTNSADAIATADDKARTSLAFARRQVSQPVTTVVPNSSAPAAAARQGFPCIMKLPFGAQGRWVRLVSSRVEAGVVGQEFHAEAPHAAVLVQEYRPVWHGRSIRAICLQDRVLAASERVAAGGDVVSNIGAGGRQWPVELAADQQALAIAALEAVGLGFGGVDLLYGDGESFALEVNSHPDFSSMGEAAGHEIAAAVIAQLLEV